MVNVKRSGEQPTLGDYPLLFVQRRIDPAVIPAFTRQEIVVFQIGIEPRKIIPRWEYHAHYCAPNSVAKPRVSIRSKKLLPSTPVMPRMAYLLQ
jgi:hypothetical protein